MVIQLHFYKYNIVSINLWHSAYLFKWNNLFTLDRLRSRKDVREVGLTSFRLKDHQVEYFTAAVYSE